MKHTRPGSIKGRDPKLQMKREMDKGKEASPAFQRRILQWCWDYVTTAIGSDKRTMALFRMMLALTVLGDVSDRLWDVRAHYSDAGVFPRTEALANFTNPTWITLHFISGKAWAMSILFILHLAFAFSMFIGYHTRISTILVWLMQNSLNSRNILVLHGGDVYLRAALFWAIWMPLGSCCSIDRTFFSKGSATKKGLFRKYSFLCAATLAMVMQVSLMYWTSVWHKTGREWTVDGTATFYALQLDYFRTPFAELMLLLHPHFLPTMTIAVLYWEWLGSALFFFPIKSGFFRTFAVFAFMLMHINFALCLRLGTFFWISVGGLTALLPTWFWESVVFRFLRTPERMNFELYYSTGGRFKFFERFSKVLATFFLLPEADVRPMRQLVIYPREDDIEGAEGAMGGKHRSTSLSKEYRNAKLISVDHEGTLHKDFDAIVAACAVSPILWPLAKFLLYVRRRPQLFEAAAIAGVLSNIVFEAAVLFFCGSSSNGGTEKEKEDDPVEFAAEEIPASGDMGVELKMGNGHCNGIGEPINSTSRSSRLKMATGAYLRQPAARWKRVLSWRLICGAVRTVIVLWFAYFVLGWNLNNIGMSSYAPAPENRWVAYAVHIDQSWNMFSPRPPSTHWWYIIEAWLVNGSTTELHRNEGMFRWEGNPLGNWEKPVPFYTSYGNHRWFKFYEQMNSHNKNGEIRLNFGRYICREWNSRHTGGAVLYEFKIWWMNEHQNLDGTRTPKDKQMLWHHICLDKKPDWPPPSAN